MVKMSNFERVIPWGVEELTIEKNHTLDSEGFLPMDEEISSMMLSCLLNEKSVIQDGQEILRDDLFTDNEKRFISGCLLNTSGLHIGNDMNYLSEASLKVGFYAACRLGNLDNVLYLVENYIKDTSAILTGYGVVFSTVLPSSSRHPICAALGAILAKTPGPLGKYGETILEKYKKLLNNSELASCSAREVAGMVKAWRASLEEQLSL